MLEPETPALAAVLDGFGLHATEITRLGGGVNRSWRVLAGEADFVLREYRSDRTAAGVDYEHEVLDHLRARDWPVAPALPASGGARTVMASGRVYSLFPWLAGEKVDRPSVSQLHVRGRLLARLHADLASFPRREQRDGFGRAWELDLFVQPHVHSFNELLSAFGAKHPEIASGIRREKYRSLRELARLGYGEAATSVIHGDYGEENLLFLDGQLSGLLDFDFTRRDSPMLDVAIALTADCMDDGEGRIDLAPAEALLSGYAKLRPFSELDARLVAPLVRAHFLWLAMFWMLEWRAEPAQRHIDSLNRLVDKALPGVLATEAALTEIVSRMRG